MPDTQKIAIYGAGIMGLCAAYVLKTYFEHADITLYDPKGFPADNASQMAGGMLAPYSEIEHMNMEWVKAGFEGIRFWAELPLKTDFTQQGSLLIAHNEDRHILERFKSHLPADDQNYTPVSDFEPQINNKIRNGLFLKTEAHLNPHKTMESLCNALRNMGVHMIADQENAHDGWLIDCRGLSANDPDLRGVKGEILIVHNPEFSLTRPVRLMHPRYPFYIIPRGKGIFMIGATVIEAAQNEKVSLRSSMELMSALYTLSPSFGEAEIITLKAGIRPSYPDNLPRIKIDKDNRTIACNGLFRHGYLLAPVMAECVRDYLQGAQNEFMPLFTKGEDDESQHQRAA